MGPILKSYPATIPSQFTSVFLEEASLGFIGWLMKWLLIHTWIDKT